MLAVYSLFSQLQGRYDETDAPQHHAQPPRADCAGCHVGQQGFHPVSAFIRKEFAGLYRPVRLTTCQPGKALLVLEWITSVCWHVCGHATRGIHQHGHEVSRWRTNVQDRCQQCPRRMWTGTRARHSWTLSYVVTRFTGQKCLRDYSVIGAITRISTRRFSWRPSSVILLARGSKRPRPTTLMRSGITPCPPDNWTPPWRGFRQRFVDGVAALIVGVARNRRVVFGYLVSVLAILFSVG